MMEKNVFLHYKALIAAMAVLHLFKHLYNKFVFLFKKKKKHLHSKIKILFATINYL